MVNNKLDEMPDELKASNLSVRVGVLALQGAVIEHKRALESMAGIEVVNVRHAQHLKNLDGIVLPGGESTTMGKLLHKNGLFLPLKEAILNGMPVYGTCAGMILLAKHLVEDETRHLEVMDIVVRRNAYGGQLDSFVVKEALCGLSKAPFSMVFIRAPWIETVENTDFKASAVHQLWQVEDRIVAARQDNMLVTSFHPELTASNEIHRYFISEMVLPHRFKNVTS